MGHQEAGTATTYPVSFQVPDDGDAMAAATFNVAYVALADRTENLRQRYEALRTEHNAMLTANYQAPVAPYGAANLRSAFFSPATQRWYVLGLTANVRSSFNGGLTWIPETLTGAAGESPKFGDCDNAGNVVISTDTRYAFELNIATGVWSKPDVRGGAITLYNGFVQYDPINARWCIFQDGVVRTSTNRTTWTAGTAAVGWAAAFSPGLPRMGCRKSTGRLVAACIDGTTVRPGYSSNGGTSFTASTTFTTGLASATDLSVVPLGGTTWLITIGKAQAAPAAEVWKSIDDGITWTLLTSLTNTGITNVAVAGPGAGNGELPPLISTSFDNISSARTIMSLDGGATWRPLGLTSFGTTTTPKLGAWGSSNGESGCMLVAETQIFPPFRAALPAAVCT